MAQFTTLVFFLFLNALSLNFLPCITSLSNGLTLKLIHRDSPLSPLYQPNISEFQRFTINAEISKTRASRFNHRIQTTSWKRMPPNESLRLPLKYSEPIYTVEVGLGTPVVKRTLIFDTGSSLTWTQCKPCLGCFKQKEPLFDSKASRSYHAMSKYNKLAKSFKCASYLGCIYYIGYYTGQFSVGFASIETFAFPTSSGVPHTVPDIVFGCGATSRGPFGPSNTISGILGMNREPVSFARQLGNLIKDRFSYCLTNNLKASYVKFGDEAMPRGRIIQRTPFLRSEHYVLRLMDISIGGRRLGLTQAAFPEGCIIDSGSSASLLNKRAFNTVKTAFMSYFARFKDVRRVENTKIARVFLCYTFPAGFRNFPNMTFHFQGADFDVPPENVYMFFEGRMFCIEIVQSRSTTILGAYQQRNVRVVYDLRNDMLSFAKEDCSKEAA